MEIRFFLCHLPRIRRISQHFYFLPTFRFGTHAMLSRRNMNFQSLTSNALETGQAQFTSFNDDLAGLRIVRDKNLSHTTNERKHVPLTTCPPTTNDVDLNSYGTPIEKRYCRRLSDSPIGDIADFALVIQDQVVRTEMNR